MTGRCLWTGAALPPQGAGGKSRKFIDNRARAEAHRAARQYALALIEAGELTWADLRAWDREQNGHGSTYTPQAEAEGAAGE
jgi:hypothetical protein